MPHGRGQLSIQCISFDLSLTALYSSVTPGTRAHVSIVSPRLAAPVSTSSDGLLVRLRYLLPLTIRRKPHSRIASRPADVLVEGGRRQALPFLSDQFCWLYSH